MFQPKPNDEIKSFTELLISELTKYSKKCPNLRQYIFCIENDKWVAKPNLSDRLYPVDNRLHQI